MSWTGVIYMTGVRGFDEVKAFASRRFNRASEYGKSLLIHDEDATLKIIPVDRHGAEELTAYEGEDEIAELVPYLGVRPSYSIVVDIFRTEGSLELAQKFAALFMEESDAIFYDHRDRIWTRETLPERLD